MIPESIVFQKLINKTYSISPFPSRLGKLYSLASKVLEAKVRRSQREARGARRWSGCRGCQRQAAGDPPSAETVSTARSIPLVPGIPLVPASVRRMGQNLPGKCLEESHDLLGWVLIVLQFWEDRGGRESFPEPWHFWMYFREGKQGGGRTK